MLNSSVQGNEFIYTSIYNSQDQEALKHFLNFMGFRDTKAFFYICMEIRAGVVKRGMIFDKIRGVVEESVPCVSGYLKDKLFGHENLIVFVPVVKLDAEEDSLEKQKIVNTITDALLEKLKVDVAIGVGKTCGDLADTATAYKSALTSLKNTSEKQKIVYPEALMAGSEIIVDKAKLYINAHLSQDISLEDVAGDVQVSVFYLSRIFSLHAGLSFVEYVSNQRVTRAKGLLKFSRLSINKISQQCGFTDQNYFTKVFKKVTGLTPSQFRKTLRD